MFSDPQSVTINAVEVSLPRVASGENSGGYKAADGNVDMQLAHQYGKRFRHRTRLHHQKVAADPLSTGYNKSYDMSVTLVIDTPDVGYTATEAKQVIDGFIAWLSASSGANITKILGGES